MKEDLGNYAALILSDDSKFELARFVGKCIPSNKSSTNEIVDPTTYHCTVMYSRKPVPQVNFLEPEDFNSKLPVYANAKWFEVFTEPDGSKCLVLCLNSIDAIVFHNTFNDMGAMYDYDEYKPHITLIKNYDGKSTDLPLPTFPLVFDKIELEQLDTEL